MTALAEKILDQAMQLLPQERRVLALRLLETAEEEREAERSAAPGEALHVEDDPVLGALWANDADAIYDTL